MTDYNALIEQYKNKLRNITQGTDYSSLYETAAEALLNAQNASYLSRVEGLNAELPKIETQYDDARSTAYQNAKLSAVRTNEALAALGLAGNLQEEAKSGVSETSRIAQDNNLRQNINLLNAEQLSAEHDLEQQIRNAGYENDQALAAIIGEYAGKIAEQKLQMDQFEFEKQQTAVENALNEVSVFGRIMTQAVADALGMPIGTMSFAVEQKLKKSGGSGGSGGGKKLPEKVKNALEGAQQRLNMPTDTYSAAYNASIYGINAEDLPAYQANMYVEGLVRNRSLTEKQAETVRDILGI